MRLLVLGAEQQRIDCIPRTPKAGGPLCPANASPRASRYSRRCDSATLPLRRIELAGLAAFAMGFVCSELTKEMTMPPRPFAVFDHARLSSAGVGLISLPEAYGGCYDY